MSPPGPPTEPSGPDTRQGPLGPGRQLLLTGALFLAMLVSTLSENLIGLLAPVLVGEVTTITEASIGNAAAVLFLTAALVARFSGRLLDDIRPGRALTLLFATAALAGLALAGTASVLGLVAFGVLGGIPLAINNPVTNRLVQVGIPVTRRGLALGLKQTGVKVGQILVGVSLPVLVVAVGWRRATLVVVAGKVVALLVSLPAVRSLPTITAGATTVAQARAGIRWVQGYAMSMAVAQSAITTYLALYAVQVVELTFARAGVLVSVFATTATLARLAWVALADRIGRPALLLSSLSLFSLVGLGLLVAAAFVDGALAMTLGVAICGATIGSWNVLAQFAVLSSVSPERVGSATGALQSSFMLGMAAGAPAFGWLVERTSFSPWSWLLPLALAALSAGIALTRLAPTLRR